MKRWALCIVGGLVITGFPLVTHFPVPVYPWWPGEAVAAQLPSKWNNQVVVWKISDTAVGTTQGFGLFDAPVRTSYVALAFNTLIYAIVLFVIWGLVARTKKAPRLVRSD
jgi:hypothetical protein